MMKNIHLVMHIVWHLHYWGKIKSGLIKFIILDNNILYVVTPNI